VSIELSGLRRDLRRLYYMSSIRRERDERLTMLSVGGGRPEDV
jgi:hypothetical protein